MLVANILSVLLIFVGLLGVESRFEYKREDNAFKNWEQKGWLLFGGGFLVTYDECIRQLSALVEYEQEINKYGLVFGPNKLNIYHNGKRMFNYYINRWFNLVNTTSLTRKNRTLTENLLQILDKHSNGCSTEEMDKLDKLIILFQTKHGLRQALTKVRLLMVSVCQERVYHAISNPFGLIGKDDIARVIQLSPIEELNKLKTIQTHKLGRKLAQFLRDLDHPSIMSLDPFDLVPAMNATMSVYQVEIFEPCSKVCNLGNLSQVKFNLVTDFFNDTKDRRKTYLENIDKTVQTACYFAQIDARRMVANIYGHFKWMAEDGEWNV